MSTQKTLNYSGSLKIGDTVLLFYNADKDNEATTGSKSGYISADLSGSTKRQLLMMQPSEGINQDLSDIQLCKFKVLASNKYEAQTRYEELNKSVKEKRLSSEDKVIKNVKRDVKVELAENNTKQERLKGSKVYYGETIQLQNVLTEKYVCVSNRESSITESTKLKLFLKKEDSVECIFRLHPHIKDKSVGKDVDYDDHIKFESVAIEGQFLHCSKKEFLMQCGYELNAATSFSPLTFVRHYQPTSDQGKSKSQNTLRACGVVRFFHRMQESYLVGEGSFVGRFSKLSEDFEEVTEETDHVSALCRLFSQRRKKNSITYPLPINVSRVLLKIGGYEVDGEKGPTRNIDDENNPTDEKIMEDSMNKEMILSDEVVIKDVHFRKKFMTKDTIPSPPTSPNTFWQIEKSTDSISGESIRWLESCRIKHLPTRRYLAVDKNDSNKVTLKSCELDPEATIFELFPVSQKKVEEIDSASLVRVKHKDTGTWLHFSNDANYEDFDENDSNISGDVIATKEVNFDDAFILEKVEESLVREVYNVSSITSAFIKFLQQYESQECQVGPLLSSLSHLNLLLRKEIGNSRDLENKQKFLRGMKTLELVIKLLKLHMNAESSIDYKQICKECLEIIRSFLEGSSGKNRMYISQLKSHIFTEKIWRTRLYYEDPAVKKVLLGIIKDNPALLKNEDLMSFAKFLIKDMAQMKLYSYGAEVLEELTIMCECEGVFIKRNQVQILDILKHSEAKLLCPFRIKDSVNAEFQALELRSMDFSENFTAGEWYDIGVSCKPVNGHYPAIHNFLLAQFKFLVMICKGNNEEVIEALEEDIDLNFIMCTLRNNDLKECPKLRALLVELLKVMFVEIRGNTPFLEELSINYSEVDKILHGIYYSTKEERHLSITDQWNPNIPVIEKWIADFLSDKSEYLFAADENDKNEVVVKVLQLLASLVKFGYYKDVESAKEIFQALLQLLDRRNDYPTKRIKDTLEKSLQDATGAEQIFIQIETDELVTEDISDQNCMESYRESERYKYKSENNNYYEIKFWAMELLHLFNNFEIYKRFLIFIYDFKWLTCQEGVNFSRQIEDILQPTLIKDELYALLLPTLNEEIKRNAAAAALERLQFIITNRQSELDLRYHKDLPDTLLDLANYEHDDLIQHSLLLLNQYYTTECSIFQKALQTRLLIDPSSIAFHKYLDEKRSELTDFLQGYSKDSSVIEELTKQCWLADEVKGFEPHLINQTIILSYNILPEVLKYTVQQCTQRSLEYDEITVLRHCLIFLRAITCKNQVVKERLLPYINQFLNKASGELSQYIGELLCEVFSGSPSITSLNVKEEEIFRMMQLIFVKRERSVVSPSMLDAIQELLLVRERGLPLKHNQLIVSKNFSFIREDPKYWCNDLLAGDKRKRRLELLHSKVDDSYHELVNLLMITDLLATCAYGENKGVESTCCTIYSEEELFEIITSQGISIYQKRPFMRFLVWVYLDVEGDMEDGKSMLYAKKEQLWKHITQVLHRTSEKMIEMSRSSYLSVKRLLICSSWKYSHKPSCQEHTNPPTSDQEFSDMLLYVSDGVLPFLRVFFSKMSESVSEECVADIYKALLALYTPLNYYFSTEVQVKLYHHVVLMFQPFFESLKLLLDEKQLEVEKRILSGLRPPDLVTDARERYNKKYCIEENLNQKFRRFVNHFKDAYEGRYTVNSSEVEFNSKGLQLGQSFQDHLLIFMPKGNEADSVMKKNPKEHLLRQLEISISKMRHGAMGTSRIYTEKQVELDIKCLQILRAFIYNKIQKIDREDKDRNPRHYRRECIRHVYPIQNEIQRLNNAVSRVLPLLSNPDEKVVNEVLLFLEALLEFGNRIVQDGLEKVAISREYNIFPTLQKMLRIAAVKYKESLSLKAIIDKDEMSSQETLDTCEYSPVKQKVDRWHFLEVYQDAPNVDSPLDTSDLHQVILISKVFGLMCEGHKQRTQNFLCEQNESIHSINMVREHASFLYELYLKRSISPDTLPLWIQILITLKKMCVGNYNNQKVIFDLHIVSVINFILQIDITVINKERQCDHICSKAVELKVSAVELLNVMLEEISIHSKAFLHQIAGCLDFEALCWSLFDFYKLKDDSCLVKLKYDDDAMRALFKVHHILRCLKDNGEISNDELTDLLKKAQNVSDSTTFNKLMSFISSTESDEHGCVKAWDFCAKQSQRIEIVYRNEDEGSNLLTRVYFNVNSEIQNHIKRAVVYKVDRVTHSDKLRDFHKWMFAMKDDMLHHIWLKKYHLDFITKFSLARWYILNIITTILCFIILFGLHIPATDNTTMVDDAGNTTIIDIGNTTTALNNTNTTIAMNSTDTSNSNGAVDYPVLSGGFLAALVILGSIHLFFALWMALEYVLGNLRNFAMFQTSYRILNFFDPSKRLRKRFCHHSVIYWLNKERTYLSISIFSPANIYIVIFVWSSAISLVWNGYFYCICLLYIVINNDILQRALQSLIKNWKSLLWVGALLLAIVFIYAVAGYLFLRQEFDDEEDAFCERLDDCFISILQFGLIDNFLDIGINTNRAEEARARFFYDITFFIIVITIGLNLVFGIVIDTFQELRNARFKVEEEVKKTCFICGLPSYRFEKQSNMGFNNHTHNDHSMWAYVYYYVYLDQIYAGNHTAIENYVYEKIKNGSILDFLPDHQALVLEDAENNEELLMELKKLKNTVEEHFTTMEERFDTIEERFDTIEMSRKSKEKVPRSDSTSGMDIKL